MSHITPMPLKIVEGTDVDLLSPFPLSEIHRAVGWMHCYKTLITSDDGPQTSEELAAYLTTLFQAPNVLSFGIIDKNNRLNIRHEAPLIGFGAFERANLRNGYIHCATTRKAWGSGLVDEAGRLVVDLVFRELPELTRISSFVVNNNFPARALAKRLGFAIEGVIKDAVVQDGQPRPMTHFGLTRKVWEECQPQSLLQSELVEQPSAV